MADVKLDAKDIKLLRSYCEDANIPLKTLAKTIGLSREAAAYRIKRLMKEGLITRIAAKIDASRFYPNAHCVFLRFSKLSETIRNAAVEVFVRNNNTMWVTTSGGEYDLIASLLTQNAQQLTALIKELETALNGALKEYAVLTYEKEYKNRFSDLFDEKGEIDHTPHVLRDYQPLEPLDEEDQMLLYALSLNAQLTNAQLGEITKLTPEAVRLRVKQLEKKNIIHGYRAMLDICKLKRETYYLLFKFDTLTPEQEKKLQTYILSNKHIYYSAKTVGAYNCIASMFVRNREELQTFLDDIRNTFSDCLSEIHAPILFKEYKHTYFPPACLLPSAVKKVNSALNSLFLYKNNKV